MAINEAHVRDVAANETVKRRDLASVFGVAIGALALTRCTTQSADGLIGTTTEPLTGGMSWFDLMYGGTGCGTTLATTAGTTVGEVGAVAGRTSAGDGGGGLFWWSGDTVSADDGGTIVVPIVTCAPRTGCWKRIFNGPLSVRWFGAQGDGSTPDDVAIQAAMNAAAAHDPTLGIDVGRGVFLPAGRYCLANPLTLTTNGLLIYGEGWQSQLIPAPGSTPVAAIIVGKALVGGGWCVLRDFSIQGQGRCGTIAGIVLWSGGGSKLENIYINGCPGDGIRFDCHYASPTGNNDACVIEKCTITNNIGYGIQIGLGGGSTEGPDDNGNHIRDCQVQSNGCAGLMVRGNFNVVTGGDWSNNGIVSGEWGIELSGPADAFICYGNSLIYPVTDSGSKTVHNGGQSQGNFVLLQGGMSFAAADLPAENWAIHC
jgi:hypothetical protein